MAVSVAGRLRRKVARLAKSFRTYPVEDLSHAKWEPIAMLDIAIRKPVLATAPLEHCRWTGATGFPYGKESSHPYVRSLLEYREHGNEVYENSYLARYYAAFQPPSLAEFQGLEAGGHAALSSLPPMNIYPWTPVSTEGIKSLLEGERENVVLPSSFRVPRSCGPKSRDFVRERLERLFTLHDAIQEEGFRNMPNPRLPYFDQFPTGDLMVRGGEARIILANGQHRASALSALGLEGVTLLIGVKHSRGPFRIDRSAVLDWPLVRSGLYRVDEALKIFDAIFDANGPGPRNLSSAFSAVAGR